MLQIKVLFLYSMFLLHNFNSLLHPSQSFFKQITDITATYSPAFDVIGWLWGLKYFADHWILFVFTLLDGACCLLGGTY